MISDGLSHFLGLQDMMICYGLMWLTESLGQYTPELVREFYALYIATIHRSLPNGKKPLTQPRLTEKVVQGRQDDIFDKIIHRMLACPMYSAPRPLQSLTIDMGRLRTH